MDREATEMNTTTAAVVEAMKSEIEAWIAGGVVPQDVASFAALHDYIDANMLAFEVYGTEPADDETDEQAEARMDRETPIFNAASDAVDAWLKAGRPASTYKVVGENVLTFNRWDCETGLTKAQAVEFQNGYTRLESDYKIKYHVEVER
jgi:hypothetical protein